ncbi:MAG: sugar transferase [Pseudobdellovibrionaceae bacterium]
MSYFKFHLSVKNKASILCLDFILLIIVTLLAFYFRYSFININIFYKLGFWLIAVLNLIFLYIFGTYDLDEELSKTHLVLRLFTSLVVTLSLVILLNYLFKKDRQELFGRGILIGSICSFYFLITLLRILLRHWLLRFKNKSSWLFIISDDYFNLLKNDLNKNLLRGQLFFLVKEPTHLLNEKNILGSWSNINQLLKKQWTGVVVAVDSAEVSEDMDKILMHARFSGQLILDLCQFYEKTWRKVPIYFLKHNWFVLTEGFGLVANPIGLRIKRLTDLILSCVLLALVWPIMVLVSIAIRFESTGSALFKQIRTGKNGQAFTIYKFRSMRNDAEKDGAQWAQKNDDRITRVGKFIRLTRLDELPQLFNVFKGDMSFVGPRPERPEFNQILEQKIPFYNLRHLVRPGITGWAQILFPYGASIDDSKEKLQYELYYIKHYSLLLDALIFLKTINVVLTGRGR